MNGSLIEVRNLSLGLKSPLDKEAEVRTWKNSFFQNLSTKIFNSIGNCL